MATKRLDFYMQNSNRYKDLNIENIVRTTQSLYTCRIIYFDPEGFLIIQINQQIDFILQQYPIETASVVCLSEWHY